MRRFCAECELAFGIVEPSEIRSTCTDCLSRMKQPCVECSDCGFAIQKNELRFEGFRLLCHRCALEFFQEEAATFERSQDPDELIELGTLLVIQQRLKELGQNKMVYRGVSDVDRVKKAIEAWEQAKAML